MYNQFNPLGMGMNAARFPRLPHFNWNSILNNTQRTLGIINQAIPIVNQMKPLVSNAKTLFKIAGAMREEKEPTQVVNTNTNNNSSHNNNNLQFFL